MIINWHIKRKFAVTMQEPAYIMKDGTSVPYIPVTIATGRDAYAASLHALFKHVADFHICVVRTFSVKYGIPEDDILKTIQESEEFKNMQVDPAICMDGHLAKTPQTPAIIEPVSTEKANPVARMKKTKHIAPVVAPVVAHVMTDEEHVTREPTAVTAIKTIRKKIVVPKSNALNAELFAEETMNAIAANTNGTLMKQVLTDAPFVKTSQPSEPIKIKTMQKKMVQIPSAAPATNAVAPATNAVAHDAPRKIIKKQTTCV
jgi:hypothetical protein